MVKIAGTDIPSGLEAAFWNIFQWANQALGTKLILKKASPAARLSYRVAARSLFVMWEPLWDSFSQTRKDNWQLYWGLLPFGSHLGARGYPGSGYSAFVYTNAPRWKAGMDLILDAPYISDNLVVNGTFDTDLSSWTVFSSRAVWNAGRAMAAPSFSGSALLMYQTLPLVLNASYHLAVDIINPNFRSVGLTVGMVGESGGGTIPAFGSYRATHDFVANSSVMIFQRIILGGIGDPSTNDWGMDNVEVRRFA